MFCDIVDLRDFYQSSLGQTARRLLRARVEDLWPHVAGERILVIGYGVPLLRLWWGKAYAVHSFMPAAQGVSYWPREGPNVSSLVDVHNLPLPDSCIDRVVILHALEGMAEPVALLHEAWRVMKSGGRLLTIVPNRHGVWTHSDRTPFGSGQPYSLFQIKKLLHQQGFLIERARAALYALPSATRLGLSLADRIEKYASRLFPSFGGVLLVEASKQLYAPRTEHKSWQSRLVLPLPMPVVPPVPAGRDARAQTLIPTGF